MSKHPLDEDLELYYLLRLSPNINSSIETHISEGEICKEKMERLAQLGRDGRKQAAGRLRDVRVSLEGGLSIRVLAGAALPGRLIHLSESEMKLGLEEALLPGIFVQI